MLGDIMKREIPWCKTHWRESLYSLLRVQFVRFEEGFVFYQRYICTCYISQTLQITACGIIDTILNIKNQQFFTQICFFAHVFFVYSERCEMSTRALFISLKVLPHKILVHSVLLAKWWHEFCYICKGRRNWIRKWWFKWRHNAAAGTQVFWSLILWIRMKFCTLRYILSSFHRVLFHCFISMACH